MVAQTKHGANLERQLLALIQPYRSGLLESQEGVQQPAPEQPREQDGFQRWQGYWSRFQNDQSWSLCSLRAEKFLFVATWILNKMNFKLS